MAKINILNNLKTKIKKNKTTKATIIGIPLDLGAENLGVDIGPSALRYQNIIPRLDKSGISVTDMVDIFCNPREKLSVGNPKLRYLDEVERVSQESARITRKFIKKGEKIIAIGGDHSINLGVVSGASVAFNGDLGMIYIDAHADFNTHKTTLSGNIHGMHVASLVGLGSEKLANIYRAGAKLKREHLLLVGGKDFDAGEEKLLKKENINCFTMMDLLASGLNPLLGLIDDLTQRVKNIWVSVDLDAIDSIYAPGVGIPNNGGLTYREIAAICKYIGKNCNVVGLDVVEYNPLRDIEQKTAQLAIELTAKLLGTDYSWYTKYMEKNRI